MNLKKKKKGFTLIELMAVIAIIAILAAVLVPTVNGYINRSKKTAIITECRTVMNAIETYNITASTDIVINDTAISTAIATGGSLEPLITEGLLTEDNVKHIENAKLSQVKTINDRGSDIISKIVLSGDNFGSLSN